MIIDVNVSLSRPPHYGRSARLYAEALDEEKLLTLMLLQPTSRYRIRLMAIIVATTSFFWFSISQKENNTPRSGLLREGFTL